ncbi:MAG: DNA-processing protein DprA [Clostridia bacterium]|nr:DNA-processing protein DprA [Clostridia bacterium]
MKKLEGKKVAIVGSRLATTYGLQIAYQMAYELASNGVTIVSGMAKGIDSAAHLGALAAGGTTIAVLGTGIDICYPKENLGLMKKIEEHGIVFSEYEMGTLPNKENFPKRNRIISMLSDFVLVVEAKERSGSLITARLASDLGIDVGCVPGNIDSLTSKGCNKLIQDGAYPVLDVKDILEML